MKGLILKDIYSTAKNIAFNTLFSIIIFLFSLMLDYNNNGALACFFSVFLLISSTLYTFSYDEKSAWQDYESILPLSKSEIVGSKYLYLIFTVVIPTLIYTLITINIKAHSLTQGLRFTALFLMTALLLPSLILPVIYKTGYKKSTISIVGIILSFAFITIDVFHYAEKIGSGIENGLYAAIILISAAAFAASYFISVKMYKRR